MFFLSPKEKRYNIAEHRQGRYLSQKLFDILIYQNPNYSDAYFEKSVAFNKRGDYAKGFELLNKAVEIDPELHLGYRGWLRLVKLKDYQGCIDDLKRLDSLTPNFVDYPWGNNIHYLLGLSYKGLNQFGKAIEEFDKNLQSEKDTSFVNLKMYLYRGISYKELKNYKKALIDFDNCLKVNNFKSPEAYYHKALVLKKLQLNDSAKINLKKSLHLLEKGYKHKNVYNEVQDELYISDVVEELESQ